MPASNRRNANIAQTKSKALTEDASIIKVNKRLDTPDSHNYFFITRYTSFYTILKLTNRWLIHHQTTSNARTKFLISGQSNRSHLEKAAGRNKVTLCATGAAITKCCKIALSLQRSLLPVITHLDVDTGTVELQDIITLEDENMQEFSRIRMTSKIEIVLCVGPEPQKSKNSAI